MIKAESIANKEFRKVLFGYDREDVDKYLDELIVQLAEMENERKEIRQNGKVVADRKDLIENIPCIVFKHEDIYFVNGTPERRRLFFNQVMGIYDIPFLEICDLSALAARSQQEH
jgi:DNA replication and repair protein RecF